MKSPELSVIIVTYNNEDHIDACLTSLPHTILNTEVIIVDNRSSDATREKIKRHIEKNADHRIRFIANIANTGYARGINQGLACTGGRYVLILGPDTRLFPNTASRLIRTLETSPGAGIAAPQLIDPKGVVQPSCRRFPRHRDLLIELSVMPRLFPGKIKSTWKMDDFDHISLKEVDQPEASCLMIARKAIDDTGPMDERFPMFFNDVDWCRRFREKGWHIIFNPEAKVAHVKGASITPHRIPMIWKSHQGFYRYFQKYAKTDWQRFYNLSLGLLLIGTALIRSLRESVRGHGW